MGANAYQVYQLPQMKPGQRAKITAIDISNQTGDTLAVYSEVVESADLFTFDLSITVSDSTSRNVVGDRWILEGDILQIELVAGGSANGIVAVVVHGMIYDCEGQPWPAGW